MNLNLKVALSQIAGILKQVKLTQEPLTDGSLIQYDGEDGIKEGQPVYLADGAQDWSLLPDGSYKTKDQVNFTVEGGLVSAVNAIGEIKDTTASGPVKQAQSKTDDSLDNNKPGQNDGIPKITKKDSTQGKGSIDLSGSGGTEAHEINLPGAGAPDSLINPELISQDDSYSTCMSKLNELHAQHSALQSAHDKLRGEHDSINSKHNALIGRFDVMESKITKLAADLQKANDDKVLMSKQISILNKTPAAAAIEEVKLTSNSQLPDDVKESKAFKIFNS